MSEAQRRRFTGPQIGMLRYLACVPGFVKVKPSAREMMIPLWRRGIVNCISLHVPGVGTQGPYFQLTTFGRQIARMFVRSDADRPAKNPPSSARVSAPRDLQPQRRAS